MAKRTILGAVCVAALLAAGVAQAQENATLTLRSGERVSGQLVDLGGVGFTVRVNGQERQIPQNDVAVIDFTGGDVDWSKFNGTSQVVLRNGQTIDGQLYDIGGTTPLKLTLKTSGGDREMSSSEVARIVIAKPDNAVATTGSTAPAGGNTITVNANQQWTATGITVRRGENLTFNATGEVRLSGDANDVATPTGAKSQRLAPRSALPKTYAGALIGRIGNGQPFPIGDNATFQAPGTGQLFLTVNDDSFADNQGSYQVTVTKGASR